MKKHSADNLRERVELLDFTLTDEGWKWVKYAEVWAGVELTGKTCIFSKLGIGARAAGVILRSRALTLHQAMRWRGQHLFLSEITEPERGWLDISAAVVELTQCRAAMETEAPGPAFPGVVTEKYMGHAQALPMAELTLRLVLVTPKPIELEVGSLVEVNGRQFEVKVPHELDPCKNEYEIERSLEP